MKQIKANVINIIMAGIFLLMAGCEDNNPLNKAISLIYSGSNSSVKACSIKINPETISAISTETSKEESQATENTKEKEIVDDPARIWSLFDSNTDSSYIVTAPHRFNVNFGKTIKLNRIKVYGNTTYTVNLYTGPADDLVKIPSLCIDRSILKDDSWNTFNADKTISTDSVILEIIPDGESGIQELEFWSDETVNMVDGSINTNLENIKSYEDLKSSVEKGKIHVIEINSLPNEISISGTQEESAVGQFHVSLTINPVIYKRAFIKYKAKNILTPVSIERRINNLSWNGGFDIPTKEGTTPSTDWIEHFEEINPRWLIPGDNLIEFRTGKADISIQNLSLVLLKDNGWNQVAASSKPEAYDNDEATSGDVAYTSDSLDVQFERVIEPESIMIFLPKKMNARAAIQYLSGSQWIPVKNEWTADLSKMDPGWNIIKLPAQVQTTALRLQFNQTSQSNEGSGKVKISEFRVCGSPAGDPNTKPMIIISYPRNGEFYGRTAYIQGFVSSTYPASIGVENSSANQTVQDNTFSLSLLKDDTRFSGQENDTAWDPIATAVRLEYNVSNTIHLTNNLLSTSSGNGGSNNGGTTGGTTTGDNGYTTEVYPDSAKTITYGPLTIEIPAGAVDEKITITIIPLAKNEVSQLNPGMINVTYPASGYRFLVNGKPHYSFKKPINISFTYSKTLLLQGQGDNDVFMYYYEESSKTWKRLRRVNAAANQASAKSVGASSSVISPVKNVQPASGMGLVISETDHFTDIINGTITVPEHPDPLLYNPNSIKDIKVGNPTEGISLIQPPAPNNRGEARVAYPIEIPAGRNGMQPQVAVVYSSEHQNGWTGAGWDIPIDAIIIDTKFGVPRYNGTETYQLHTSSSLVPLVPVGDNVYRARIEGGFARIIRHGTTCNTYWWEVIDKNGTHYIYGRNNTSCLKNSRDPAGIPNDNGNIYMWCLEKVIDANNNNIKYEYYHDTINSGAGEPSTSIYLNKISYTGTGEGNGNYSVAFNIDIVNEREDKMLNCRGGFQIYTRFLLKSIDVLFNNSKIRSYNLIYKKGEFNKNLLDKIEQIGSKGTLFYSHTFEYYDDVSGSDSTSLNGFSDEIEANNEIVYQQPLGLISGDNSRVGSIGGTKSIENYTKYSLAFRNAFLVNESHNIETSELLKLIDINGDGLVDQVYVLNDKIYYRPNLGYSNNTIQFAEPVEIDSLSGIVQDITHDTSDYSFLAWFVLIPQNPTLNNPYGVPFANGHSNFNGPGECISYFTDVNGDGLPDLIKDRIVYYNTLDQNGKPVFTLNRPNGFGSDTDKIYVPGKLNSTLIESSFKEKYHLDDPIIAWEAPYSGNIKVSGYAVPVNLYYIYDTATTYNPYYYGDGLSISIQKNNEKPLVLSNLGNVGYDSDCSSYYNNACINYSSSMFQNLQSISVAKGDRLFFRLNSRDNGSYDCVKFNPVIEYINGDFDLSIKDENNNDVYRYEAQEDVIISDSESFFIAPIEGTVDITGILTKQNTTSDDIDIRIYAKNENGNRNQIYSRTITGSETGNFQIQYQSFHVDKNDIIECELRSDTEIDWRNISLLPVVTYTSAIGFTSVTDEQNNPLMKYDMPLHIVYYPVVDKAPAGPIVAPKSGRIRVEYPTTYFGNTSMPDNYNATVTLAVKKDGLLVAKEKREINTDYTGEFVLDHDMEVIEGDKIYFVCASDRNDFENHLKPGQPKIYYESDNGIGTDGRINKTDGYDAVAQIYKAKSDDNPFAGGYRSWYFGRWNGNIANLDTSKMVKADPAKYDDLVNNENYEELIKQIDTDMTTFSPMHGRYIKVLKNMKDVYPYFESKQGEKEYIYAGKDNNCFVGKVTMYNMNKRRDEVVLLAGSTRYIKRLYWERGFTTATGEEYLTSEYRGGLKSTDAQSQSYKVDTDFIDLNGDLYPDFLSRYGINVQYTRPDGSLDNYTSNVINGIREFHSSTKTSTNWMLGWPFMNTDMTVNGVRGYIIDDISNFALTDLVDINGDGLPDQISSDTKWVNSQYQISGETKVKYNLGYKFSDEQGRTVNNESLSQNTIKKANSDGSGPYADAYNGIATLSMIKNSGSDSSSDSNLYDVNGDGLPDLVTREDDKVTVRINTGTSFTVNAVELYSSDKNLFGASSEITKGFQTISINTWTLCGFPLTGVFEVGFSIPSLSKMTVQMIDVNGDNLPDLVKTDGDGKMVVRLNNTGRTNLLKKVTGPLGHSFELDYKRKGNTARMPRSEWTLSGVTVNDGRGNGNNSTIAYDNGYYDRNEREFYGFGEMVETRPDGSTVTHRYHNDNYYLKGIEYENELRDSSNNLYLRTRSEYETREISEKIRFPYLRRKTTYYHEGIANASKLTTQTYEYDDYGNIFRFKDNGDEGGGDDITATIGYQYDTASNIVSKPKSIEVRDGSETLIRMRTCKYDGRGNMTKLEQYGDSDDTSITDIDYNLNGTMKKISSPPNSKGHRYYISYTYDDDTQSRITGISDKFDYSSQSTYNAFGSVVSTTDLNNNTTTYEYDEFGRLMSLSGPDNDNGKAKIDVSYVTGREQSFATAINRSGTAGDDISVTVYVDGFGRTIRTDRSAAVSGGASRVSTGARYDAMGRVAREIHPYTSSSSNTTDYTYDVLGRKLRVIYPDNKSIQYRYGFGTSELMPGSYFSATARDQAGKETTTLTDLHSNIRSVNETGGTTTLYEYSPLGEITAVVEDAGNRKLRTTIGYDKSGRRTSINNPDTGFIEYNYDPAGNVKEKITPNLRAAGTSIKYEYDFNRLEAINYPGSDDIKFFYGGPTEGGNRRGRIMKISTGRCTGDGFIDNNSFQESRTYDSLGNVSEITRSIAVTMPVPTTISKTTKYSFDGFGRMKSMTFPDDEKINYSYDSGGMLKRVTGENPSYEYVKSITYNAYGQRESIAYGNGVTSRYEYTGDLHRLRRLVSSSNSTTLQNIEYEYDDVGNITKRSNNGFSTTGEATNTSEHTYGYDSQYRLVSASGTYNGKDGVRTYGNTITYDSINNIASKVQTSDFTPTGGSLVSMTDMTYSYAYTYGAKPHAVTKTGDGTEYGYDKNGNMTGRVSTTNPAAVLNMAWDEDNRLTRSIDAVSITDYKYDHAGKRVIKKGAYGEVAYINENYSIRNGDVESKQIFAGNTRVATKMSVSSGDPALYYYHGDHLGSSSVVTTRQGGFHEGIEYFPYGETWVQEKASTTQESTPYKFTSKEQDPETGMYYFGARFYDAKLSKWISTDKAFESYIPDKGEDESGLPGYGGVYNSVNINPYQYTYNNPVKHIDPDGNCGWIFLAEPPVVPTSLLMSRTPVPRWAGDVMLSSEPVAPRFSFSRFTDFVQKGWDAAKSWWRGSSEAPGGYGRGFTKNGTPREPAYRYWKEQVGRKDLSGDNVNNILNKRSPIVDKQWSEFHNEHEPFMGDKIELHHRGYSPDLMELPRTLHRGAGYYNDWHPSTLPFYNNNSYNNLFIDYLNGQSSGGGGFQIYFGRGTNFNW